MDDLIFEDLILCFFGRDDDMVNGFWRKYLLHGDEETTGYMEAFPMNEYTLFVTDDSDSVTFNYIKD